MLVRVMCAALHGVEAFSVSCEVDCNRTGIPSFTVVGLPDGAVREARERVLPALRNSALRLPPSRITVNLAPADRRKGGTAFDLPMAVGLLAASGLLEADSVSNILFAAELSLTGELRPVPGILPMACLARESGCRAMVVAPDNASEAAAVEGLAVFAPASLSELTTFLAGKLDLPTAVYQAPQQCRGFDLDFAEVKGQEHAKRAIEVAAAGGHNLLLMGPPGSGKTMLARRIPSVLPPLTFAESLEVSRIYSVAGLLGRNGGLVRTRPFRSPHHTVSHIALVGGGTYPRPGEVSLAHRGVLFLDEFPEFTKQSLETLRQPLEEGLVTISRASATLTYPARVMLVAAMNPCPCGYATDPRHACTCSEHEVARYRSKLSGPLLDRIDMHIEVPAVPHTDLAKPAAGDSSAAMAARVMQAREVQAARYAHGCNADLVGKDLDTWCRTDQAGRAFLARAADKLALSARAYTRILRISRTIADLDGRETIGLDHLAEALNFRILDRKDMRH